MPHDLTNFEEVILRAADRIKPGGGLIGFADLFQALPQSRGAVKKVLLSLRDKGYVHFQRHNFPAAATRAERKAMIREGSSHYLAFEVRRKNSTVKAKTKSNRKFSPAQLRAQRKFAAMARARAKAARTKNKTIIKAKRVKIAVTNRKRNAGIVSTVKRTAKRAVKTVGKTVQKVAGKAAKTVGLNNPKRRRNVERRDSQHPIEVSHHYRKGPKGYKTPWQRAHEAGQRQLFQVKNPRGKKASPKVRKLRAQFTGRKSTKTTVMSAPKGTPKNLAKLGRLISIKAEKGSIRPARKNPGSTVWLCADANGKLHLCTSGARLVDGPAQSFGQVREVEYETSKPHLGHKRQTIFFHKFGEEGGTLPTLYADGEGGLKFRGGTYKIKSEGIVN